MSTLITVVFQTFSMWRGFIYPCLNILFVCRIFWIQTKPESLNIIVKLLALFVFRGFTAINENDCHFVSVPLRYYFSLCIVSREKLFAGRAINLLFFSRAELCIRLISPIENFLMRLKSQEKISWEVLFDVLHIFC